LRARNVLIGAAVLGVALLASVAIAFSVLLQPAVRADMIGVVDIYDAILESSLRDNVTRVIRHAIEDDSIQAVVLRIESPGGAASLVEEIYMTVKSLASRKPVIASVQSIAASGGYYIAVAAEYIYTQPTAIVGSVGVLAIEPEIAIPVEGVLETGPYKDVGFSPRNFSRTISLVFDKFVEAVMAGRGSRLRVDRKTISKGMVYIGIEAVELGLVDEIGSLDDAVNRAASRAGITEYTLVYLNSLVLGASSGPQQEGGWLNKMTRGAMLASGEQSNLFYMYVPPNLVQSLAPERKPWLEPSQARDVSVITVGIGTKKVVLDVAHDNWIYMFETSILLKELTLRGASVIIVFTRDAFLSSLREADAVIIAAPYYPYDDIELSELANFVARGGRLLLIGEPTRNVAFINFVAMRFGVYFSHGYISDQYRNYFNYRYVEISEFGTHAVTQNIGKLVLFTATHIYSGDGLAFTSDRAYLFPGEISGQFTPIVKASGGGVIALGDLTLLTEPFVYIEDNYRLLVNLVEYLLGR